MRIYFSLLFLFGISISNVFSQEVVNASRYDFSSLAVGSDIQVTDPLDDEENNAPLSFKEDRKFRVELFYNRNNHTDKINATFWKMDVTVVSNVTSQSEVLKLEYSSTDGIYSSWADFNNPTSTPTASTMSFRITNIVMQKMVSGTWQTTTNTADLPMVDIHIEAMALNDRLTYIDLATSAPKLSLDATTSEISWDYVRGAIEYDVEWVFIDDNDLTNFTYNSSVPQGPFEFKEPVRITTYKHHHQLDLIYPKGKLYLRVRPKGYFQRISGDQEVYDNGDWYYIQKTGGNAIHTISTDFEGNKNWAYSVAYAENGLSKGVVTYLDGTYRSREQLTKMKSTGQVVATGTVYDSEGRQSVQIIPTPIVTGSLAYFNQLHTDATGGVFDKADFDLGTSNVLGTNSGAGQYYSSNNALLNDPFRERIPNAEGYAYTQVDYINDNRGLPRKTSGVGKTHRMGGGHETQYFYAKPTDRDLRELFGSNVGEATHYDKQIVVDPNGQARVNYTDQLGRTIASGLYGDNPSNLMPLDNNTALGTVRTVSADLMENNIVNSSSNNKTSIVEYFHLNMGTNSITLNYNLTSGAVNSDPLMGSGNCASCFYKLEVSVFDPTGNAVNLNYNSQTDGLPNQTYPYIIEKYSASQVNCGSPTYVSSLANISSIVNLTLTGEYRIYKVLSVDQDAVNAYLATTALTLSGAPNLTTITNTYLANAITTGCGFDCASFYEQECREQNGISLTTPYLNLTTLEKQTITNCTAIKCALADDEALSDINGGSNAEGDYCSNILDVLKGDVSPGGWVFEDDDTWRNNTANWNYALNKTGGGTYNPSGSLANLEANWDDNFTTQLVLSHPEYCHYTKCTNLNTLKVYNQTLTNITTYALAVSGGYINSSTWAFISTPDPLYSSSIYTSNIATFNSRITNYNGYSSIAAYVTANANTLIVDDVTGLPLTSGTTAYNDKKWNVMKKLYLGTRDDFMEDYYTPTCGYYASSNANFIDPNATIATDQAGGLSPLLDPMNVMCSEICNNNVTAWMQNIQENCPALTSTQLNTISNNLQNYCLGDCGSYTNSTGTIQLSDITTNSYLQAVQSILVANSYSLVNMSTNDGCTNTLTNTIVAVTQVTNTTVKNLALVSSLANDNYATFINNPSIVSGGYTGIFSLTHWNSANMKVELINNVSSYPILTISNISEISIVDQMVVVGSPSILKAKLKIELIDGTILNYWITSFKLYSSVPSQIAFPITALMTADVVYKECLDEQANPFEVVIDLKEYETDCIDGINQEALILATQAYNEAYSNYINGLMLGFSNNCFSSSLVEKFTITYPKKEYAFTLYYYDQAGNLVQTIPPQGVNIVPANCFNVNSVWNGTEPLHTMKTIYTYNSLDQITKTNTPDGGISQIWYNYAQQARFSQNAEQTNGGKYAYTKYDALGRPYEVGVAPTSSMATTVLSVNTSNFPLATVSVPNIEVVITHYGIQDLAIDQALGWKPKNLNSRITAVAYYDSYTGANPLLYNNAIFYSYDIHGNVVSMLTDTRTLDGTNICNNNLRYKTMDYVFDVYSGKVKEVWYQKEQQDQFIHRYEYDDDNRITAVYTSTNGVKWEQDATYYYYLHGPLARVEYGDQKVQGVDYAYTVHGWLKGVNSNTALASKDLGKDGVIVDETGLTATQKLLRKRNRWMAQDVYGFSLTYFNQVTEQDYTAIDSYTNPWLASTESAFLPATNANLYNGNIRAVVTALKKENGLNNTSIGTVARVYKYDQLDRIKEAQTYTATNLETANSWLGATTTQAHFSSYQYDLNGNITRLIRNGGNSANYALDDLTYSYYTSPTTYGALPTTMNRLARVTDPTASANYSDDIEGMTLANNYTYDNAGRLVGDNAEEIQTITWTATNKVKYIQRKSTSLKSDIGFKYNPMGIRIAKIEYPKSSAGVINTAGIKVTFYALDAQGNTMATYTQTTLTATTAMLEELDIYGASRLGLKTVGTTLATTPNYSYIGSNNKASALVELTASTYTTNQGIQFKVGTTALNNSVTWTSTLLTNVTNLVNEINNQTVLTDVSASVWYSNNTANTYIIQLKYGQAGNWNLKALNTYANGIVQSTSIIKRAFGFGLAKGNYNLGKKRFELSNHLSSVNEVISDRKWGIDDGVYNQTTGVKTSSTVDGIVDFYISSIILCSDFDVFGAVQDGRNYQSDKYRYGYQGSEKDNEIKGNGNSYTTEFRLLDPRIGRWLSIDPMASHRASQTPYNSMSNNPISRTDPLGNIDDWIKQEGSNNWEYDSRVNSQEDANMYYGSGTKWQDDDGSYSFDGAKNGVATGDICTLGVGGNFIINGKSGGTVPDNAYMSVAEANANISTTNNSSSSSFLANASFANLMSGGPSIGREGKGVYYTDWSHPDAGEWLKQRQNMDILQKGLVTYWLASLAAPFVITGAITTAPTWTPMVNPLNFAKFSVGERLFSGSVNATVQTVTNQGDFGKFDFVSFGSSIFSGNPFIGNGLSSVASYTTDGGLKTLGNGITIKQASSNLIIGMISSRVSSSLNISQYTSDSGPFSGGGFLEFTSEVTIGIIGTNFSNVINK